MKAKIGALFLVLMVGMAAVGASYALWSKTITLTGTVATGNVHAYIQSAFTDDDNKVDDSSKDSADTGTCILITPGSCDPSKTGVDPKDHYDKNVASSSAGIDPLDNNKGTITVKNGYPSYHTTAWFKILNDGTIPVKVYNIKVNGVIVTPSVPQDFDLDGDGIPDLSIHITGVTIGQQIDPGEYEYKDVDIHVLQGAKQGVTYTFTVTEELWQWNEKP